MSKFPLIVITEMLDTIAFENLDSKTLYIRWVS